MIKAKIDDKNFRKALTELVNATRQRAKTEVSRYTKEMRALAARTAPKAHGNLRKGIEYEISSDGLTGTVSSTAPYARWVEGYDSNYQRGRGPGKWPPFEPIYEWVLFRRLDIKWQMTPRSATYLVRRKIAQKGTPAQPHMKPAFEATAPKFEQAMSQVVDQAAREVSKLPPRK